MSKLTQESKVASQEKKSYPVYFYLIALAIPVVFFVLLEFSLRVADYGEVTPYWEPLSPDFPDYLVLNSEISKKYFNNLNNGPTPWPDPFLKVKTDRTFRIFVLGESSAAGYPYDLNATFSQEIERRLTLLYPGWNIEVVNTGMSAISSYTLLDLTDPIIEQKPDAILIYTGHNEYYGALGVGSSVSIGNMRWIVKWTLKLEQYRTVQLVRSFLGWLMSVGADEMEAKTGTLMEQMVKEQSIPFRSSLYETGLSQFRGNMSDILSKFRDAGIPVILSRLVSNLKDQPPFISEQVDSLPAANDVFLQAQKTLLTDSVKAKSEFMRARELDLLRFRASEDFNTIISDLGREYNCTVVQADSLFAAKSQYGIVGNSMMVDHLHPIASGYRLLGEEFTRILLAQKLVPPVEPKSFSQFELNQLADRAFPLTNLDSLIAYYKIKKLRMSWPFVKKSPDSGLRLDPENKNDPADVLAVKVVNGQLGWEEAHVELAKIYERFPDGKEKAIKQWRVLWALFRFNDSPVRMIAQLLINRGDFNEAYPYLLRLKEMTNDAFSNKWIAIIVLAKGNAPQSIPFFEQAYEKEPNDTQMLYNYAGALMIQKNNLKALEIIEACLKIDPNFPDAESVKSQILASLKVGK